MKNIENTIELIERQFGKGSIVKLGSKKSNNNNTFSSGSYMLNEVLGGGYPKGRIVEIYGPESSGKTTLTLHAIAEIQKNDGVAAFIDAEHALDPVYAKALGVDIDNLLVSQPDTGEQALEIVESLVRSNTIDLIVIDSVAALTPRAEIEGDMGDSHMGLHARLMSQALRKLTGIVSKSNCCIIFINQLRMKIGVMFGSPETTTGGRALKFYASVRIDIRRIETLTKNKEATGNKVRVKIVKNKLAAPFREAELEIKYGQGINKEADIFNKLLKEGGIKKSGSWYILDDQKFHGKEAVEEYIRNNNIFSV